jgi:lysophospholipase L1-like esterase
VSGFAVSTKRLLAAATVACSLVLAPAALAQSKDGPLAGGRYVAMGSSFAAGSGFGPIKPGTPTRCGRSFENYPTLLAEALRMVLIDVTCGGATTANILGPWNELPPQIAAVNADTDLVTITIGGNDIGYVGYLIAESCKVRGPILLGGANAVCPEARAPDDAAYAKLEADLRAIAAEVRSRAPRARLVFVQYLAMVPKEPCVDVPLTREAAETARDIGRRLAEVTAKVARQADAIVFEADKLASKRLPCGSHEAWVAGWPADYKPGDTFPWHPTRAGHAVIAREVAARFDGASLLAR